MPFPFFPLGTLTIKKKKSSTAARWSKTFKNPLTLPRETLPFNPELMGIGEASWYSFPLQGEHTSLSLFLISRFYQGYTSHKILFLFLVFFYIICTSKIYLHSSEYLWDGQVLIFKKKYMPVLSNLFVLFIETFFNKLPLKNKATNEEYHGRNPSAVQPIQMFKERLSALSLS